MRLAENPSGPGAYHEVPDPGFVYRLSISHGTDAVAERYAAFSWKTISTWISIGRLRATGKPGRVRRSAEERQRIVSAVFEHGSPAAAALALGMARRAVRDTLVTEGVTDYPRLSRQEHGRRQHRALRAARSTPKP